jgi:6-phosphogluconolactonase
MRTAVTVIAPGASLSRRTALVSARFTAMLTAWALVIGGVMSAAEGRVFVYVSGYAPEIACFTLDSASGTLTPSSTSPGGSNPSFLAWSADHRFVYAINEINPAGRVVSFSVNPVQGALTRINDAASAGSGPCHLAVHPGGRWLATANYTSGHVGILPIRADGSVGEPVVTELAGKNAHEAVWDEGGTFLFVPCAGSDAIAQYRFDPMTGALTHNQPASVTTGSGAGPRHLVFNPTHTFAYGINEQGGTITTYAYSAARGVLTAVNVVSTLPAGFSATAGANSTAEIQIAMSGAFLYGSNRGHDSIAIFALDAVSGLPTLIAHETGGGVIRVPRHFSIDGTGSIAFVANQGSNSVTIFRIDPRTGTLHCISTLPVGAGPSFVAAMPAP